MLFLVGKDQSCSAWGS